MIGNSGSVNGLSLSFYRILLFHFFIMIEMIIITAQKRTNQILKIDFFVILLEGGIRRHEKVERKMFLIGPLSTENGV